MDLLKRDKRKVVVFGTGSAAEEMMNQLDTENIDILFFVDNNPAKHGQSFREYPIVPPDRILSADFDYVLIASQYSQDILNQLTDMGIPYRKVVPWLYEQHLLTSAESYRSVVQKIKKSRRKPSGKIRIAVTNYNNSNFQGYALMKYLPADIARKYQIDMLTVEDKEALSEYDVIVSSHYDGIYDGDHINIELFHGFPLKRLGVMFEGNANPKTAAFYRNRSDRIHLFMSYSQLYTVLFNSSFHSDISKYRITGMPRNDLLFEAGALEKLETLCGLDLKRERIAFYLPTWRFGKNGKIESDHRWSGIFGLADEDPDELIRFAKENRLFFVIKLHPFEFEQFKDHGIFKHERFFLLHDDMLTEKNIHLYEIVPSADVLITDYSSIYFDTLLIDLPVIFALNDLQSYKAHRGFMFDPYEPMMPGPFAFSQDELLEEIRNVLDGKDAYRQERERVRNMVFKYVDNQASVRVWREIDRYLTDHYSSTGGERPDGM